MYSRDRTLVPALVLVTLCALPPEAHSADAKRLLLPPTAAPLVLTSSFGEYRAGHYHGGVDFSTGGKTGIPVQTPADGWVFRVRASGVGYGRAVYFRIEDGRTFLFAHLDRFHPEIQARVEAIQDEKGRYEVDHYPRPRELRFAAGDILGYTGKTGAGPPHLHAEVRTGSDASVAINPLGTIWHVPDSVPPTLTRLLVEPAEPGVQVNGGVGGVVIDLERGDPLEITGPVRLWVESSDYGQSPRYRMAPKQVTWTINDKTVFEVFLDAFHWNWAREVEWTFHTPRARKHKERWINLEPAPGTRQSTARWLERDWSSRLAHGRHQMTFVAVDHQENRTEKALLFQFRPPRPSIHTPIPPTRLESRGGFLDLWVVDEDVVLESPSGIRYRDPWIKTRAGRGWLYQLGSPPSPEPGAWTVTVGSWRRQVVWLSGADGDKHAGPMEVELEVLELRIRLRFPEGAVYHPLWITVNKRERDRPLRVDTDMNFVSGIVELGPWGTPLRERIDVSLSPAEIGRTEGLVLCSLEGNDVAYEGASIEGHWVSGQLSRLSTLAVFRDTTAPGIRFGSAVYDPGQKTLSAEIQDGGAGVVWRDLEMSLDGKRVIAEWDPDARTLIGHLREPLSAGVHELEIVAGDRAGNTTGKTLSFSVP